MLLMLVLIVMIISIALLLALFSGFFPFVQTYGNVVQYSTAYYGAISAIERGALMENPDEKPLEQLYKTSEKMLTKE